LDDGAWVQVSGDAFHAEDGVRRLGKDGSLEEVARR
jgi:hypothetical protein